RRRSRWNISRSTHTSTTRWLQWSSPTAIWCERNGLSMTRAAARLRGLDQRVHDRGTGDLLGRLRAVRRALELGDRVRDQHVPLHQPRTEARQGRLTNPHRAQRQVRPGHVVHPALDHRAREVRHPRQAAMPVTDEDQELLQDPSVGPYSSFRLASLLALEVTELLNQVGELLRHGLGPPPRATTTFSLIVSIRRHDPSVKLGPGR